MDPKWSLWLVEVDQKGWLLLGHCGHGTTLGQWLGGWRGQVHHPGTEMHEGLVVVLGVDVAWVVVVQLVVAVGGRFELECELWVCDWVCCHFCGFLGLFVVCFVAVRFVGYLCLR